MKGLLLSQYYSVEKSFWGFVSLSIVGTSILLVIQNDSLFRVAAWIPLILMSSAALEVLKHESMSGWNKFVFTLPLKRRHIVQSHYFFYFVMIFLGLMLTITLFTLAELMIGGILIDSRIYSIMNGSGIVLTAGAVAYPLTYHFGIEKSDAVLMSSIASGMGLWGLSGMLFSIIWGNVSSDTTRGIDIDLLFSTGFFTFTLLLFIVSYFVAVGIYKRKEF